MKIIGSHALRSAKLEGRSEHAALESQETLPPSHIQDNGSSLGTHTAFFSTYIKP